MSDFVLKVSTDVMIQQADAIKNGVDSLRTGFNNVAAQVRSTRNFWQGDASDLHINRFDTLKTSVDSLVSTLRGYPDELLRMAGLYDETERRATEDAVSLPVNILD